MIVCIGRVDEYTNIETLIVSRHKKKKQTNRDQK